MLVLVVVAVGSVLIGSRPVSPAELLDALGGHGDGDVLTLLWRVRAPRTLAALAVGVALAVAGALMQTTTRNPLADPGLLGVGAGSAFFVTVGMSAFGLHSALGVALTAIAGAAVMTILVLLLGLRGGDGSRLILAGIAFSTAVLGVRSMITLLDPRALDALRAWSAGSLAAPDQAVLAVATPFLGAGLLLAAGLVRPLDALGLGEDLARGLGTRPTLVRAASAAASALLVGGATAVAGPLAFVGLMVPHAVRPFTGPGTARVLAACLVVGPALVLLADTLARVALWPGEIPVGVVTAALGAPVLIVLSRRGR
ncbi:iron ABC transporter permease [Actinosynnema sp. NPDC020468]|uniref:FecCD family ABC transporter permease n=1 Tax=Actinosynnema sp. NPDC020468 TaxID=3154488 RepID=UPI0033F1AD55